MKLLQNIQAATPRWAAQCMVILGIGYSSIVALQELNIIDILPIDPEKRKTIKAWVTIIVAVGGLFFASQKKGDIKTIN